MAYPFLKSVRAAGGYKLLIEYQNGERRWYDASCLPWRSSFYAELGNPEYFMRVSVDEAEFSVSWPNGQDIAPEELYEGSLPIMETIEEKIAV